jgi:uncharacterized protein YprB with RNaseH-like and TPR domain
VDLKSKLGRLLPVAPREPPAAPPGRQDTLEALRRQMAGILGREAPARQPRVEPELSELPFERVETASGPLHRRTLRLSPSHHVGRMPVDAARAAGAEVLALLALDPGLGAVAPERALYLDTETTGLGGSGTLAFLVGLASFQEGALVVEQLLLRSPAEERPMLEHLAMRLVEASGVVSFNGKAFDVPTLEGRYVMNRLPVPDRRPHLDLLHVARRLHRSRIRSCTLKGIESEVLGFVRDADIDGGDVAPRYGHYLRTGDPSVLAPVVEHNTWDVVSMAALVGLYGEPLGVLAGDDLVGLARTYARAGALDRADEAASAALSQGTLEALRVRGEIGKARGDKARALSDFEALAAAVDDPRVRLELAKLYEHHVKAPGRALELVLEGTGERPETAERRRARLERKLERAGKGRGKSRPG